MNDLLKQKLQSVAEKIGMDISDLDLEKVSVELTESQINEISESLEANRSESSNKLLLLPSNNGGKFTDEYNKYITSVKEEYESKEFKAIITITPDGMEQICMVKEKSELDIFTEDTVDIDKVFSDQVVLNEKKIITDIGSEMDLSYEESKTILGIILEGFSDTKNIFSKLPKKLQDAIMVNIGPKGADPKILDEFAVFVLSELKKSLIIEQQVIDLNESVKKELQLEGLSTDIIEEFREETIKKFELVKQTALDSGMVKKAEQVQKSIDAYNDAFTYEPLKSVKSFGIGKKKYTKKKFFEEQIKYVNTYCTEFNNRYKTTSLAINDIKSIIPILRKQFPDVSINDIHKFVILFVVYSRKLKVSKKKIEDHIFMYYVIKNIIFLYDIENTAESQFFKDVEAGFRDIIDYINK